MKYKYVVHETAALAGKAATFMPKPIADDIGDRETLPSARAVSSARATRTPLSMCTAM